LRILRNEAIEYFSRMEDEELNGAQI